MDEGVLVVRLAPAKLNLTLAVTGRREDGFHALHSVMVPLELADRLAITPAFAPGDRLHVTGGVVLNARAAADSIARLRWHASRLFSAQPSL